MKTYNKLLSLGLLLAFSIFLGIWKSSTNIPLAELFSVTNQPILQIRLCRVALALFAGMGLGCCGVVLQAILRNPLAEPYLLGTSSGAGLGAIIAIMLGIASIWLPLAAFIGALISIILVYNLARQGEKIPVQSLILSGVIVAISFSGIIIFLVSISTKEALHTMMWWMLGNLQVFDIMLLAIVGTIVVCGVSTILLLAQDLNAISLGEDEAIHLGIDAEKIKKLLFVIISLVTGALVSVTGIIGFVGLIIPHILRYYVGPNHKILIPATCLGAPAFLIICDTISRTLCPPVEIPIGVITSLVGAPIFIYLMRRQYRGG